MGRKKLEKVIEKEAKKEVKEAKGMGVDPNGFAYVDETVNDSPNRR